MKIKPTQRPRTTSSIQSMNREKEPIDVRTKWIDPKPNIWALAFMLLAVLNIALFLHFFL